MTDHYDEMRVPPDASLAEALRQRLHARMAGAPRDDHEGRSRLQLVAARLESEQHLVPVKENNVSVDSPTTEIRNGRRLAMAAAAVVAVIGVAAIAINRWNSDDGGSPSAASPTVAPTTIAPTRETGSFAGASDVPVTFNMPAGWQLFEGWAVSKAGAGGAGDAGVSFMTLSNTYANPCQWVLVDPPVGPTVDDLVSAWPKVPGLNATAAVDVTVDGHVGKQIEFTVPNYKKDECKQNKFGLWQDSGPQGGGSDPDYWAQGPNQHNRLWIFDVSGARLVINAWSFQSTSQQDQAALNDVLASIRIG
jgi:hypothetical protein